MRPASPPAGAMRRATRALRRPGFRGLRERCRLGARGALAAEFALVVPVVALMAFGTVDLVLFMRAQVKVEGTAVQVGQAVSQCRQISTPDIAEFWRVAQTALSGVADVSASGPGTVIITAVNSNAAGNNRVAWQSRSNSRATSAIGSSGAATLPAGYVVPGGQLMIVTEVYAPVRPWFLSAVLMNTGVLPQTLGATSLYLSRTPDPAAVTAGPAAGDAMACMG
ncbi:MAG: pilus assembly protein [Acetobacteraceae bacterium]|nr:pilus assembly protein [Acetobacteraceae bacterium]